MTASARNRIGWVLLVTAQIICSSLLPLETYGKALMLDGYVDSASTNFAFPMTHVLRSSPGERITFALVDPANRLHARPLERIRLLGKLASDQTTNGVPVVQVDEVWPADWAYPQSELSPITAANWNGYGSSLYPGIAEEPLPQVSFSVSPVAASFLLTATQYEQGVFHLTLTGETGWTCVLEGSDDLEEWHPISTNIIATPSLELTDPDASKFRFRFYRARMSIK